MGWLAETSADSLPLHQRSRSHSERVAITVVSGVGASEDAHVTSDDPSLDEQARQFESLMRGPRLFEVDQRIEVPVEMS
jgi:hypothetical protein